MPLGTYKRCSKSSSDGEGLGIDGSQRSSSKNGPTGRRMSRVANNLKDSNTTVVHVSHTI
jgi:hypothetical protein